MASAQGSYLAGNPDPAMGGSGGEPRRVDVQCRCCHFCCHRPSGRRWVMSTATRVSGISGGLWSPRWPRGTQSGTSCQSRRVSAVALSRHVRFTNRFTETVLDVRLRTLSTDVSARSLSHDLPLFRPDITPVGADFASVMRCCRSLLPAVGRCCCCHRCCHPSPRRVASSPPLVLVPPSPHRTDCCRSIRRSEGVKG